MKNLNCLKKGFSENLLKSRRMIFMAGETPDAYAAQAEHDIAAKQAEVEKEDATKGLNHDASHEDFVKKVDLVIGDKRKTWEARTDIDAAAKVDMVTRLNALRGKYLGMFEANFKAAEVKRDADLKAFTESASVKLAEVRRAKVAELLKDPALKAGVDKLSQANPFNFNVAQGALKVVYLQEGKAAAEKMLNDLLARVSAGYKGKSGTGIDNFDLKFVFGAEMGDVKKLVPESTLLADASLGDCTGRMMGYLIEGGRAFVDGQPGDAARAAYSQYIQGEAAKFAGKQLDTNNKQQLDQVNAAVAAILTPTEWVKQHTEFAAILKDHVDADKKLADLKNMTDQIKDPVVRKITESYFATLLKNETDPAKQDQIIAEALAKMGKKPEDLVTMTDADLKNIVPNSKEVYGNGVWKMQEHADVRFEVQGRLSGLVAAADHLYDDVGFKAEYRTYVQNMTTEGSDFMKNVLGLTKQIDALAAKDPNDPAIAGLNEQVRALIGTLKSPADYLKEYQAGTEKRFVETYLANISRKGKELATDTLEGSLVAAIKGKERGEWGDLIQQRLAAMGMLNSGDLSQAVMDGFTQGREAYGTGWRIDSKSKGYISGLLANAENMPNAPKDFAAKYRAVVEARMKGIDNNAYVQQRDAELKNNPPDGAKIAMLDRQIFDSLTNTYSIPTPEQYLQEITKPAPAIQQAAPRAAGGGAPGAAPASGPSRRPAAAPKGAPANQPDNLANRDVPTDKATALDEGNPLYEAARQAIYNRGSEGRPDQYKLTQMDETIGKLAGKDKPKDGYYSVKLPGSPDDVVSMVVKEGKVTVVGADGTARKAIEAAEQSKVAVVDVNGAKKPDATDSAVAAAPVDAKKKGA